MKAAHGLTDGRLGVILLSIVAGAIGAMQVAPRATRHFGSRAVALACTGFTCILLPMLVAAPTVHMLLLTALAFGGSMGGIDVAINTQATSLERQTGRTLMSGLHGFFSIGGLAGAATGAASLSVGLPPVATMLAASLLLCAAAWISRRGLLDDPPPPATRTTARARAPMDGRLLTLGALAFVGLFGEGAMGDWSAVYLRDGLGAAAPVAGFGYVAYSFAMTAGRFAGDRAVASLGPVAALRIGGALVGLGLLGGLLAGGTWVAIAGFAVAGLGLANTVPILFSAAASIGEARSGGPSQAIASVGTLGYVGFLVGPPLIGFTSDAIGLRQALGIVSVAGIVLSALAGSAGARRRRVAPVSI